MLTSCKAHTSQLLTFFQVYYITTFQITAIPYGSKHQQKLKSRNNQNNFLCEFMQAMTVTLLTSTEIKESLVINSVLLELDHVRSSINTF